MQCQAPQLSLLPSQRPALPNAPAAGSRQSCRRAKLHVSAAVKRGSDKTVICRLGTFSSDCCCNSSGSNSNSAVTTLFAIMYAAAVLGASVNARSQISLHNSGFLR